MRLNFRAEFFTAPAGYLPPAANADCLKVALPCAALPGSNLPSESGGSHARNHRPVTAALMRIHVRLPRRPPDATAPCSALPPPHPQTPNRCRPRTPARAMAKPPAPCSSATASDHPASRRAPRALSGRRSRRVRHPSEQGPASLAGTLNCQHADGPNDCKVSQQWSCRQAMEEIGPSGSAVRGLVEPKD